jgi:hypothetical protein
MAKRTSKKASSKKSATRKSTARSAVGKIKVTRNSISLTLDAASQKKMRECLAKSGKVTFSIKEHSFTRLPAILENGKSID